MEIAEQAEHKVRRKEEKKKRRKREKEEKARRHSKNSSDERRRSVSQKSTTMETEDNLADKHVTEAMRIVDCITKAPRITATDKAVASPSDPLCGDEKDTLTHPSEDVDEAVLKANASPLMNEMNLRAVVEAQYSMITAMVSALDVYRKALLPYVSSTKRRAPPVDAQQKRKRAKTGYNIFLDEVCRSERCSFSEVADRWRKLNDEEKKVYNARAKALKDNSATAIVTATESTQ